MTPHLTPAESVTLLLLGVYLACLITRGLIRAAGRPRPTPPQNAAPAPVSGAQEQARAARLEAAREWCSRHGHAIPDWAHTDTLWFCTSCDYMAVRTVEADNALPYDQEAATLVAEAEAFLQGRAS